MNKDLLAHIWDHTRQTYGIYMRLVEAIPEDKFHTNPIADMRTPAELIAHTSGSIVRDIAQGLAKKEVTADESKETDVAQKLKTKQDILDFAKDCWTKADAAMQSVTDEHLNAEVPTPWNWTPQGRVLVHVLNEEFLHHRGQLSAFVRATGGEPTMIWGFEQNAEEFKPKG